jgi:hypothetical protein
MSSRIRPYWDQMGSSNALARRTSCPTMASAASKDKPPPPPHRWTTHAAICAREVKPSLARMWATWWAIAWRLYLSRRAIAGLDRPSATSPATSSSRGDSGVAAPVPPGGHAPRRRRTARSAGRQGRRRPARTAPARPVPPAGPPAARRASSRAAPRKPWPGHRGRQRQGFGGPLGRRLQPEPGGRQRRGEEAWRLALPGPRHLHGGRRVGGPAQPEQRVDVQRQAHRAPAGPAPPPGRPPPPPPAARVRQGPSAPPAPARWPTRRPAGPEAHRNVRPGPPAPPPAAACRRFAGGSWPPAAAAATAPGHGPAAPRPRPTAAAARPARRRDPAAAGPGSPTTGGPDQAPPHGR